MTKHTIVCSIYETPFIPSYQHISRNLLKIPSLIKSNYKATVFVRHSAAYTQAIYSLLQRRLLVTINLYYTYMQQYVTL